MKYFGFIFFLLISTTPFSQKVLKDGYVYHKKGFKKLDILIEGQKIIKIGKNLKGKAEESLKGLYIYPGFVDSHLHINGIGKEKDEVNLKGCKNIKEILEKLKEKYKEVEKGVWIIGRGWDQNLFEKKEILDNKLISKEFKENPLVLYRVDGHMLLANEKAMEISKIDKDTKVEGGEIIFEKGLFSDKAMDLILKNIPKPNEGKIKSTLKNSFKYLKTLGFISLNDLGIDHKTLKAYISLEEKGEIPLIVYAYIDAEDRDLENLLKKGPIIKENFKLIGVKVFMDGALGSWGAYLSIPYKDKPNSLGNLVTSYDKLLKILYLSKRYGFKVAIHSIGDEATTIVLKAIEKAKPEPLTVRLEHLQILKYSDLDKMKNLKVVASVQPYHYFSDLKMLYDRIDKDLKFLFYPWKSFLKNKILLLAGSDAPVENPDFKEGFLSLINRERENLEGFEAIEAYTLNNFIFHREKNMGKIEKGYFANFTILNKDILKEKEGIEVWGTMLKGKWIYRR